MKVLIIIPAYNEEDSIEQVIRELESLYPEYDYLVINDCSKDHTEEVLKNCSANYLNLPVNLGIGGGVQSGYRYAMMHGYDIAIQMDGDGQHDPRYIKNIIEPIEKGEADSVIGSRFINNEGFQSTALRRFGISFLSNLIKITSGVHVIDVTSGFRAVNQKGIALFSENYAQDYPEPEAIVVSAANGLRIKEVPVQMRDRMGGVSSIGGFKSIYYMIKVSLAIIVAAITVGRRKG